MHDFQFTDRDLNINDLHEITAVTNIEETKQDLVHRLSCVKGSDVFFPDYGTDWLKIKRTTFNRILIEHEVRKALKTHDNVKSIDRIIVSNPDAERKIDIIVYITLMSGTGITVEVSL